MVNNVINESSAMKNIKNVMEGKDDGVILLTDVYSEETEDEDVNEKYSKHKEVLENINDTLDFINNDVVKQTNLDHCNNQRNMLKSLEVKESLKKLQDAKVHRARRTAEKQFEPYTSTSIEELLIKLLRPQLTTWLNENLPAIVEKEVKNAVEKIVND